jgi:hypothetical protein
MFPKDPAGVKGFEMPTPADVAQWMFEEVRKGDWMYQDQVVEEIAERFGEEFTYENENGNPAIDKAVLKEFRKLSSEQVVWVRGERCWRLRERDDEAGRQKEY